LNDASEPLADSIVSSWFVVGGDRWFLIQPENSYLSTLGPPLQMMISQPFRDLTTGRYQHKLYLKDWFAYKLILLGSRFKYHIG